MRVFTHSALTSIDLTLQNKEYSSFSQYYSDTTRNARQREVSSSSPIFKPEEYHKYIKSIPNKSSKEIPTVYIREYIITNILTAICINCGYDGIVFSSVHSTESLNYVLFDPEKDSKCLSVFSL